MKNTSFRLSRSAAAYSIKIMTILFVVMAIFHQDLEIITSEALRSELTGYVLLIPFLLIYLLYRRRKMLKAVVPLETVTISGKLTHINEVVGALFCLTALLFYWVGSHTFYSLEYHILSLPLFVSGLILILFNAQTLRVLIFPITLLFLLTPPPSEIAYIGGASIATLTSEISYSILKFFGLPVSLTTEYGAPIVVATSPSGSSVSFVIGAASSGIYSLIGFGVFAAFLVYIARGPLWKRAILFLVSLPLIYVLNITRVTILILVGYWQGINIAMDFFHLFGGWILLLLGSLIVITLSERVLKAQIFAPRPRAAPCADCNPTSRGDHSFCQMCGRLLKYTPANFSRLDICKIIALIVFATMITTISVPVFALTEGPPQILTQQPGNEQATAEVFPEISGYDLRFVYRDTDFEARALRDRALVYAYMPANAGEKTIWISLEIGSSISTWHEWEASVINWRLWHGRTPTATQLDLRDVQLLSNPPIIGKFFAFLRTQSNSTQVVLYWYETALFNTGDNTSQKYVKISLVAFPENPKELPQTEELLLGFARTIAKYWQPVKTWSTVALAISQNGLLLIGITTITFIAILAVQILERQRNRKANLNIYHQLTNQEDKLIFKAIKQAKNENKQTTNAIAVIYEKLAGKPMQPEILLKKLNGSEEAGLVKKEITSQEDEPLWIWKSQIPLGKGF